MIILYFCLVGFPLLMVILKIKNKEYDEAQIFIWVAVWIILCTIGFYYMDWLNFDYVPGLQDPDWIRK